MMTPMPCIPFAPKQHTLRGTSHLIFSEDWVKSPAELWPVCCLWAELCLKATLAPRGSLASPPVHRTYLPSEPGPRACYSLSRRWRCARKSCQTRRRTKTLVLPRRGRQRSMARFSPQSEGLGPIFPISASIVAKIHPVSVAPLSLNSEKLAPSAARAKVNNRL